MGHGPEEVKLPLSEFKDRFTIISSKKFVEIVSDKLLYSEDDYSEISNNKYTRKINNFPKTIHFIETRYINNTSPI